MRRFVLAGLLGGALLALGACASQGYGSGGGFDEYYDDCYDGYCMGYNAYGRLYERPKTPATVARGGVDRIDRSHGTPQTVSRDGGIRMATASPSVGRMSASPPPPPPPPTSATPR